MESKTENNRKQGKPKGLPKSGGRPPGGKNIKTTQAMVQFQQACEKHDFDFGGELIGAFKVRDLDYAKVLISVMDYYFGKVPPQKIEPDNESEDNNIFEPLVVHHVIKEG